MTNTTVTPGVLASDPRFSALAALSERLLHQDVPQVLVNLVDIVAPQALPYLVDQFHVADLDGSAGDDDAKRILVSSAIALHRHKGTPWAIKEALRLMGVANATLTEWFDVAGVPGTFSVAGDVFDNAVDQGLYSRAQSVIERAKNARSQLVKLQLNLASSGASPYVAAISTQAIITEIYPREQSI